MDTEVECIRLRDELQAAESLIVHQRQALGLAHGMILDLRVQATEHIDMIRALKQRRRGRLGRALRDLWQSMQR